MLLASAGSVESLMGRPWGVRAIMYWGGMELCRATAALKSSTLRNAPPLAYRTRSWGDGTEHQDQTHVVNWELSSWSSWPVWATKTWVAMSHRPHSDEAGTKREGRVGSGLDGRAPKARGISQAFLG